MKKLILLSLSACAFAQPPVQLLALNDTKTLSSKWQGNTIAFNANKVLGTKYVYGGNDLKRGVDCSALVQQVYKKLGYQLPRTAANQATKTNQCKMITSLSDVKIGDALYFRNKKGKIHHVALVSDFNKYGRPIITHAKGEDFGVIKETLSDRYINEFIGAKRFYNCTVPGEVETPIESTVHKSDKNFTPIIIKA